MPVSPAGAAAGKLSRAFDRVRGRGGHRQLLELDEEGLQTSSPPQHYCGAAAAVASRSPTAPATTTPTLDMSISPSTHARSSPGAAIAGKVSRALDRVRGRRNQQLLEPDAEEAATAPRSPAEARPSGAISGTAAVPRDAAPLCAAESRTRSGGGGSGGAGSRPAMEDVALGGHGAAEGPTVPGDALAPPQPWLLKAQLRSARDVVSKLGRRGEEKSRML